MNSYYVYDILLGAEQYNKIGKNPDPSKPSYSYLTGTYILVRRRRRRRRKKEENILIVICTMEEKRTTGVEITFGILNAKNRFWG